MFKLFEFRQKFLLKRKTEIQKELKEKNVSLTKFDADLIKIFHCKKKKKRVQILSIATVPMYMKAMETQRENFYRKMVEQVIKIKFPVSRLYRFTSFLSSNILYRRKGAGRSRSSNIYF